MKHRLPIFLVATGGTLLEWAEYILYAYLAHMFSDAFFPAEDPLAGILATYAVLAVGFLMRPLGAWFFGHIGDNHGRKPALMYSLATMGLATAGIGLMPTYAEVGVWAPIGLIVCRLLQGFAIGGEFHGAGIYLVEHSKSHPYFTGSWVSASAAFGMVVGASIASLVSLPCMPPWAWRVPFVLGGLVYGFILYYRRALPESPVMSHHLPITDHDQNTPWHLFLFVMGMSALVGTYVYVANVYFVTFMIRELSFTLSHATFWALLAQCCVTCLIPISGYMADRYFHPFKQLIVGTVLAAVFAPVFFWFALEGTTFGLLRYITLYAIINAIITGPMITTMVKLFPPKKRYRGIAITWNIVAAFFGGAAPMVATALGEMSPLYPSFYISSVATCVLLVFWLTRHHVPQRLK